MNGKADIGIEAEKSSMHAFIHAIETKVPNNRSELLEKGCQKEISSGSAMAMHLLFPYSI